MNIIEKSASISNIADEVHSAKSSIGFVPTMGSLHSGHIELIKQSQLENARTFVSIYLNPTQFDNKDDLKTYPVSLKEDIKKLQKLNVDYLFTPNYTEIYPDNYSYKVIEENFSKELCGESREGHFDGVLTVVLKLLLLIRPTNAYFGEKDFQQLELINGMVEAFFLKTNIRPVSIQRDKEGLALSSRNKKLSSKGLFLAREFAKTLSYSQLDINDVKNQIENLGIKIDYLKDFNKRRYAAVFVEGVRLIDNVEL